MIKELVGYPHQKRKNFFIVIPASLVGWAMRESSPIGIPSVKLSVIGRLAIFTHPVFKVGS